MEYNSPAELSRKEERKRNSKYANAKSIPSISKSDNTSPYKTITPTAPSFKERPKLRTSKDIYNHLKWDSKALNIDLHSTYIGYKDRFLGMCEIHFDEFQPTSAEDSNGDIPYHRIYYFRGGGPPLLPHVGSKGELRVRDENFPPGVVFYWDRDSRQDIIFHSGNTNSNPNAKLLSLAPTKLASRPIYKYHPVEGRWASDADPNTKQEDNLQQFTMLSLNVLFDLYDPEIVQCSIRWPFLIEFLKTSNAPIIALQEVTTSFLQLLESQNWVQQDYYLTEISESGYTINPYGQIIMSKIPPNRVIYKEILKKRFIIASFSMGEGGEPLHIANIHLSNSMNGGDAEELRRKQLEGLMNTMKNFEGDAFIVGDTNFGDNESIPQGQGSMELLDAWDHLHGAEQDPGWTFNIHENTLARRQSKKMQNMRYDRIFFKSNNSFRPTKISIEGRDPIDTGEEQLFLSDHYALLCQFDVQQISVPALNDIPPEEVNDPIYNSSIVIIPPREHWSWIQDRRSEFDTGYPHWPPHLTLFFRFLPDLHGNFEKVQELLNPIESFTITLNQIGMFDNGRKCTLHLKPRDEDKIRKIYHHLLEIFPSPMETEFNPHLTLARMPYKTPEDKEMAQDLIKKWSEELTSHDITFSVNTIHLISNKGCKTPFRIRKNFPLDKELEVPGGENGFLIQFIKKNNLLPSEVRLAKEKQIAIKVSEICNLVLGSSQVILTGSSFMGFHDDSSDLDFLCIGIPSIEPESFFSSLKKVLNETPEVSELQLDSIVLDTKIPIARLIMLDTPIDLVYSPSEWSKDPRNLRCLNAVREADKLLLEIVPSHNHEVYRTVVGSLKFWAKKRNIYGKNMGLLGSSQIALIVAYVITLETKLKKGRI